jgi:hypothetical protein
MAPPVRRVDAFPAWRPWTQTSQHDGTEAQERYLTTNADAAIEYLSDEFKDRKGKDYEWITNWLSKALKRGNMPGSSRLAAPRSSSTSPWR